jgi:L-lactate dehydrogenase complex protein LldF
VYSGPIGAILTPLLQPELADADQLPQASSLCGACQAACPVRIGIPDLLLRLRADAVAQGHAGAAERATIAAWQTVMTNPALYRAGGQLASIGTRLLARRRQIGRLPPPLSGWTTARDFPAFAARSFNQIWEQRDRPERDKHD